jgi:hypothetical protein
LTLCGIQFSVDSSEYWVYEWPIDPKTGEDFVDPQKALKHIQDNDIEPIGWSFDTDYYQKASLSKWTEYGRVKYHLLVYVKNDTRTPSTLNNATLCLGAQGDYDGYTYVGADYEQVADVYGPDAGLVEVVLPVPENEDIGQNVILCPWMPCPE